HRRVESGADFGIGPLLLGLECIAVLFDLEGLDIRPGEDDGLPIDDRRGGVVAHSHPPAAAAPAAALWTSGTSWATAGSARPTAAWPARRPPAAARPAERCFPQQFPIRQAQAHHRFLSDRDDLLDSLRGHHDRDEYVGASPSHFHFGSPLLISYATTAP